MPIGRVCTSLTILVKRSKVIVSEASRNPKAFEQPLSETEHISSFAEDYAACLYRNGDDMVNEKKSIYPKHAWCLLEYIRVDLYVPGWIRS